MTPSPKKSTLARPLPVFALAVLAGCATSSRTSHTTVAHHPAPKPPHDLETDANPTVVTVIAPLAANSPAAVDVSAPGFGHVPAMGMYEPVSQPAAPLNTRQITFATEGQDFDPCVTPDGSRVVFASTQHRATPDIYIKGVESRVVTQLTDDPASDAMPAVSPDGTRIAFASDRAGNWDVYVMPITGGKAVQITSDPDDEIHPSWSPDGTHLVFCRHGKTSQRWEMWVTDVQTQATSSFIGYGVFPSWCPAPGTGADSSDRILFQLGRERGQRSFAVWTIDYKDGQASNATEVASSSTSAFINPAWSPDGRRVVFASVPNQAEWRDPERARPSNAELWMVGIDGEGRVNLTPGRSVALMPCWSSNNQLYFVGARGGVENIWSLDAAPAVRAAMGTGSTGSMTITHTTENGAPTASAGEPAHE